MALNLAKSSVRELCRRFTQREVQEDVKSGANNMPRISSKYLKKNPRVLCLSISCPQRGLSNLLQLSKNDSTVISYCNKKYCVRNFSNYTVSSNVDIRVCGVVAQYDSSFVCESTDPCHHRRKQAICGFGLSVVYIVYLRAVVICLRLLKRSSSGLRKSYEHDKIEVKIERRSPDKNSEDIPQGLNECGNALSRNPDNITEQIFESPTEVDPDDADDLPITSTISEPKDINDSDNSKLVSLKVLPYEYEEGKKESELSKVTITLHQLEKSLRSAKHELHDIADTVDVSDEHYYVKKVIGDGITSGRSEISNSGKHDVCSKAVKPLYELRDEFVQPVELIVAPVFENVETIVEKMAKGESVPTHVSMRYEKLRLSTFKSYPRGDKPFLIRFAQSGFYYGSNADEVICYVCTKRVRNWTSNDDPMTIHKLITPDCKFLTRNADVNVPLYTDINPVKDLPTDMPRLVDTSVVVTHVPRGQTEIVMESFANLTVSSDNSNQTLNGMPYLECFESSPSTMTPEFNRPDITVDVPHTSLPAYVNHKQMTGPVSDGAKNGAGSKQRRELGNAACNQDFGLETDELCPAPALNALSSEGDVSTQGASSKGPIHPHYAMQGRRFQSFASCPSIAISPIIVSEAGFYYAGMGDCSKCFYCNLGLRHWSADDDPWEEHARFSNNCIYVRQKRGQEYLDMIKQKYADLSDQQPEQNMDTNEVSAAACMKSVQNSTTKLKLEAEAQKVRDMGYSNDIIFKAIDALKQTHGHTKPITVEAIINKIQQSEGSNSVNAAMAALSPSTSSANSDKCSHGNMANDSTRSLGSDSENMVTDEQDRRALWLKVKEEHEELLLRTKCYLCDREACAVYLPCGHFCTCEDCAKKQSNCNICGDAIKGTIKAYRS